MYSWLLLSVVGFVHEPGQLLNSKCVGERSHDYHEALLNNQRPNGLIDIVHERVTAHDYKCSCTRVEIPLHLGCACLSGHTITVEHTILKTWYSALHAQCEEDSSTAGKLHIFAVRVRKHVKTRVLLEYYSICNAV